MTTTWRVIYALLGLWVLLTIAVKPGLFATQLISGLVYGMILVMIALGLTLILGLMGVINFAHGAFFMLGAYLAYAIVAQFGFSIWIALIAAPIGVGVLGVLVERFLLRRLYGTEPINGLLLTFGLALMIEESIRFIWGSSPMSYSADILTEPVPLLVTQVAGIRVFTTIVGIISVIAIYLLIVRTDFGLSIRAGVQDPEMTELVGENLPIKFTFLFFIGSALAGLAGVLRGAETGIDPGMASLFIILVFVVIVVGGIGSFFGSVAGGLLIGTAMFLAPTMLNTLATTTGISWINLQGVRRVVPFVVMIVVLLARPRGLFGEEGFLE
ncbi:branched-chain amino acid ABC transporter permease (plasmid) [Natrinema zhouii]|uniref:branched-chain amino acid ABC transporter permease n=1 Tax=Natrinema zhouii TaxID=1710539 RepID=UPI001CFF5D32|nr:branched-chain amino acid ABC transporter permease [Natrinema zhouii]UHQ98754.1 branched-chain amino acid ABC transporter permease [Natrinema zhouii]